MIDWIRDSLYSKRKVIMWVVASFAIFFLFYWTACAEPPPPPNPSTLETTIIGIIQQIVKGSSVFIALMTFLATVFLSPEWINGSLFWMTIYFRQVWIVVSNVVYLIFAFILVYIAFMNIIWKTENYKIKTILPKFIIWILIVPLSWFIVQFILSLSAVLTITALNLPFDTFEEYNKDIWKIAIPKHCTINLSGEDISGKDWEKPLALWAINCKEDSDKVSLSELLSSWTSSESIFWVVATYTYWVMDFESLDKITEDNKIKTIFDLLVKTSFDVVFVLMYLVIIAALWIVLFTRWVYIWIYIMMSPIFGLMYFFDKNSGDTQNFFGKFTIMEFFKLAMVPVLAMAALSFGLLLLYVVSKWSTSSPYTNNPIVQIVEENGQDSTIKIAGKLSLTVKWPVASKDNPTWFLRQVWNNTMWVIGSIIVKIFGLIILWWAMMAALKTSKITEDIIAPLAKFGTDVWWIVKQAPMYLPILPWWASIASAGATGSKLTSSFSWIAWEQSQKSWGKFVPDSSSTRISEAWRALWTASKDEIPTKLQDLLRELKKWQFDPSRPEFKEELAKLLDNAALGLTDEQKADYKAQINKMNNADDLHTVLSTIEKKNKWGVKFGSWGKPISIQEVKSWVDWGTPSGGGDWTSRNSHGIVIGDETFNIKTEEKNGKFTVTQSIDPSAFIRNEAKIKALFAYIDTYITGDEKEAIIKDLGTKDIIRPPEPQNP